MPYAQILAYFVLGPMATAQTQQPLNPPILNGKPDPSVKVSDLINVDGAIDAGLPKSAAPGAKLPKDGDPIAILNTTQGRIVIRFFPAVAPNAVTNFLYLSNNAYYDGTRFHRVVPGFMIQGGDPNTRFDDSANWGTGGPSWTVPDEFSDISHTAGILSMAHKTDANTAGSQFFILEKDNPKLNHQYTAFGQVIEGMDVVDKIANSPRNTQDRPNVSQTINKVEVTKWPIQLNGLTASGTAMGGR